jgi:hypothetical protein
VICYIFPLIFSLTSMRPDGKETKAIMQLMANNITKVMSSSYYNPNSWLRIDGPHQETSGDRTFESGSHLPIHPQTTFSCAALNIRAQQTGSSGVVFSKNGRPPVRCCGSMGSVRRQNFPCSTSRQNSSIAGSGKSVLWYASHVFPFYAT